MQAITADEWVATVHAWCDVLLQQIPTDAEIDAWLYWMLKIAEAALRIRNAVRPLRAQDGSGWIGVPEQPARRRRHSV